MHHTLDTKSVPEKVLYINEPDLADATINYFGSGKQEEESQADHIRVYVPLDLSADAILRRLRFLVCRYEEANERNEFNFSIDVGRLVSQIEIYDQVWFAREGRTHAICDRSWRDVNEGIAGLEGPAIIILCHLNRSLSGLLLYENEKLSYSPWACSNG